MDIESVRESIDQANRRKIDLSKAQQANRNEGIHTTRAPGSTLDKDAFMMMLVTQMKNQDPMNPMDNSQMSAQMAQFSSLEQMQNMNERFEQFQQSTTTAFSLMNSGRSVALELQSGDLVEGTLEKVQWSQGETQFVVDGKAYSAGSVRSLRAAAESPAAAESQPAES